MLKSDREPGIDHSIATVIGAVGGGVSGAAIGKAIGGQGGQRSARSVVSLPGQ